MSYYLGVDIGTFETKGVLADPEGRIVARAARGHKMLVPQAGWAEHRPREDWWGDFVHVTGTLLADSGIDPGAIRAVATSAIGPCMLPVDAQGEPLMNAVLYGVDNRAATQVDELTAQIGEEAILERCGNALTAQSVGPKILWLKRNHPDIYARTAHVLNSTSFLVQRLTGRVVIDHYSAANTSPLYDMAARRYVTDLSADIIEPERLPEPVWTTEIVGQVAAKAAAETGLAAGTPVTAGTIDAAAEAVSIGVLSPQQMMVMYGSSIFIIMPTAQWVRDRRLWSAPWLFEGQYASMAGIPTAGTLTHWFRDQFARDLDAETAFADLVGETQDSPPGANGLILLPYFSGARTPIHDSHAKGMLFGLDLTHTRGDMFRALLEGIAYGTAHVIETYRDIGQGPESLHAVGGGTRNAVWMQATSDVAAMGQVMREKSIGASYGDAFLAALALGDVAAGDIERWNPIASEVAPLPENAALYQRQYAIFKNLYSQTRDLMAAIDGPL
ncbi:MULTISPECIES: FGGY-family carbohydrate kinase [unclassified Roseitalea]|uniref:FGGY-family carbohydrate kinase n=1 Tax=unclassified Roseitalea TaxID=2639107 RepID=UPI00273EFB4B|nr:MULTISPECIES: FGGY-family carbohydrate kinase [unclassified Roseitalea]